MTIKRSNYHHGDLRRSLIDSSIVLLREQGVDMLTLREVAKKAGVSHAASYRHFDGKEQLLAAVAEQAFVQLRADIESKISKLRTPITRLKAAGLAYVEFALEHPEEYELMFSRPFEAESCPDTAMASEEAFHVLLGLVTQCDTHNDAFTSARIAWAQVHGISGLILRKQLRLQDADGTRKFVQNAIKALLDGLIKSE